MSSDKFGAGVQPYSMMEVLKKVKPPNFLSLHSLTHPVHSYKRDQ